MERQAAGLSVFWKNGNKMDRSVPPLFSKWWFRNLEITMANDCTVMYNGIR
jgi:hypothetical protein